MPSCLPRTARCRVRIAWVYLVALPTSHRRHLDLTRMLIASKECDSFTYIAQRQAPRISCFFTSRRRTLVMTLFS